MNKMQRISECKRRVLKKEEKKGECERKKRMSGRLPPISRMCSIAGILWCFDSC